MDDPAILFAAIDGRRKAQLARRLLVWFDRTARDLPWRRTKDLYRIWVSEIMLQQTQVATVVGYYQRFLAEFPSVQALAAASEEQVLRQWEGLGYYRRARQMQAAARQIVRDFGGRFPASFEAVRSLPGIGRYTAGAILSIGLDQRLPILEANTVRVLSRLTAFAGDTASGAGQRHLWSVAEQILPRLRAGAFNQALMELGSEVCTPRGPACEGCPVAALCPTRELGLQAAIPAAKKRTAYAAVTEAAVVVRRGSKVLVRQCPRGERWAGLWDFPRFGLEASEPLAVNHEIQAKTAALTGVSILPQERLTTIKHGVTRFRITLHCYAARYVSSRRSVRAAAPQKWLEPRELHTLPLSVTGRKISRLLGSCAGP
jgi:A/G-specific adenine glycosylase